MRISVPPPQVKLLSTWEYIVMTALHGFGLGLRPEHYGDFVTDPQAVEKQFAMRPVVFGRHRT